MKLFVAAAIAESLLAIALRAEPPPIVVAHDGSGQFKTIQAAIDSVPETNTEPRLILIKPGTYHEQVMIREGRPFITLRGEDKDSRNTVITFDRYATVPDPSRPKKRIGLLDTETASFRGNDFTAENLTFQNTAGREAAATAARTVGDRQVFRNCRFLGWQDTLCLDGKRTYFQECYLEGRVDFIYGSATAVFEKCHLHAIDGGVITAASTKPETPFGFVFLKCKVTCQEDRSYLGAPWQPGAACAFIECELGANLWPQGWTEWRGEQHHRTARFVEYKNTGPGAQPDKRPAWTRHLTDTEAKAYTVENILGGTDGWNPKR